MLASVASPKFIKFSAKLKLILYPLIFFLISKLETKFSDPFNENVYSVSLFGRYPKAKYKLSVCALYTSNVWFLS